MSKTEQDVTVKKSNREDWLNSLPENGRKAFEEAVKMYSASRYEEAHNFYAMALLYSPDDPVILTNMGVLLRAQGKIRAAEECYRRALAIDPDSPGCWTNLGNVLRRLGKLKDAAYCHRKAFKLDKNFIDAYYNFGLTLQDLGKLDEAIKVYDFCLKAKPGDVRISWDRSLALLSKGDLLQGFEAYEYRWYRNDSIRRDFKQPLWDGSPLNGRRILLYSEQGLGDTLQFCRYVAEVANAGGKVILECQKELVSLLSGLEGLAVIVSAGKELPEFDVQAPLLSLPRIMKHDLGSLPSKCPYLTPPSESGFSVHVPPGTNLKVGIVWAGRATHKNDHNRSVEIENFFIFSRVPGVMLYSLQKGEQAVQREKSACGFLLRELASGCDDFGDTAKVLSQLDLVITVDTSVAHLAGALGIPVWVAIPYNSDWRWMRERTDSPWYPSMTLFRQECPGDWEQVFKNMLAVLIKKVRA
ncbi:tetratricopeptide repeat protein [Desulfovibrio gilichinskyi]|uniref:Glycosyltransferase family 9 (Heptosyltransferase) n=1 Tax=Desulfovibrio gilichinskyi TaxID=1519643 RepID=A0A1X7DRX7_9BACT|nr:tetratricopeptide repeat-containing glycosyltransferase family protein [Desulfovibrio gilichinskyi]SMF20577.1 Glycosyltransferase family 9 (heptosyltransferase) [Desulfovibrio gilichinskyi]